MANRQLHQKSDLVTAISNYLRMPTLDNRTSMEKVFIQYNVLEAFILATTNNDKKGIIQLKPGVSINDALVNSINQLVIAAQQKITIAELTTGNVARFF